jgi:hypothetical protein
MLNLMQLGIKTIRYSFYVQNKPEINHECQFRKKIYHGKEKQTIPADAVHY